MLNRHIAIRESWPLIAGNPIPYLNCLRDTVRAPHHQDKFPWPRGKLQFGRFMAEHGGPSPEIVASIAEGRITGGLLGTGESVGAYLKMLPAGQYFCKTEKGGNGIGAFRLDISGDATMVDGVQASLDDIARLLSAKPYLIQKSLTHLQHSGIARFSDRTINTLRLVTFATPDGAKPICGAVRISCAASAVDNWFAGGVMVPIDLGRGEMGEFGVIKDGLTIVGAHPQSGLPFRGQSLPHFREAVDIACRMHEKLNLGSLGWDIAMLRDGPCMLEANRAWDVYFAAQLNHGFIRTFLDFHILPGRESARLEILGYFRPLSAVRRWLCEVAGLSRASARVEYLSQGKLVLIVGGSRASIETAMHYVKQSAAKLCFRNIRAAPAMDVVSPGLDVSLAFKN